MMQLKIKLSGLAALLMLLSGCAVQPAVDIHADYTSYRAANPHSILVVPVVSRSVDVDAPDYFLSTIVQPLSERGFYVFPVNLVKHVMEDDGLGDANLVHASDAAKLANLFGAESVLYVTIERWDSKYMLISTITTVELSYSLKSGVTGAELWKKKEILSYDPNEGKNNGLLGSMIAAAFEKAKPNYLPLSRKINGIAVYQYGHGLPAGPYDDRYLKDQLSF